MKRISAYSALEFIVISSITIIMIILLYQFINPIIEYLRFQISLNSFFVVDLQDLRHALENNDYIKKFIEIKDNNIHIANKTNNLITKYIKQVANLINVKIKD